MKNTASIVSGLVAVLSLVLAKALWIVVERLLGPEARR